MEGETEALIPEMLRVQVRRVEDQAVTVGRTVDSRLPVEAVATSADQSAITIFIPASAEEGERS